MKYPLILIFIIIQFSIPQSQQVALPCLGTGNEVSYNFHIKNYEYAKRASDKCMAMANGMPYFAKYAKYPKSWYYRGLVYQKFYEDFDSLNESFEKKYFRNMLEADILHLFGRLTKDTTLRIASESFLNCICRDVINDTLEVVKILNDSIYRKNKIERFNTFIFTNDKYIVPLKDTILPQILKYLNNNTIKNWENQQIFVETFKGIIENTKKTEEE